jgi:hypothetical protein
MKNTFLLASFAALLLASCTPSNKENDQTSTDATELAATENEQDGVYFVNLNDGDKLKSPVIIEMGVRGMTVEPAGKVNEGMGHHHIIVDGSFIEKGQVVPMDETHIHFGKGQTTDTLSLAPGSHTLTLQFANGVHDSYGKDWSKSINITVEE